MPEPSQYNIDSSTPKLSREGSQVENTNKRCSTAPAYFATCGALLIRKQKQEKQKNGGSLDVLRIPDDSQQPRQLPDT
uniref:Uncharacterized protein n=1 Tax=Physcomitrium patens TaxID=3218 RepID=A0A2K1L992_PHYPA|nr:hypothetical protein PHYPA_001032 [Physcomitrium patens]